MKMKKFSIGLSFSLILALLLVALSPVSAVYASSPTLSITPDSGETGTTVTITGSHFTEDYYYYVFFDKTYQVKGIVNSSGKFTKSISIPSSTDAGNYKIVVKARTDSNSSPDYGDDYDESASAYFEVTEDEACIELDNARGLAGDSIQVSGYDFDDDYYYYIFFDEELLGKGAVNDAGEFTKTVTIPADADTDDYTIQVLTKDYSDSSVDYDDADWEDQSASADFEVIDDSTPTPVTDRFIPAPVPTTENSQVANNPAQPAAAAQNNNNLPNQTNGDNSNNNNSANNNNGNTQGFWGHLNQGWNWFKNRMPW